VYNYLQFYDELAIRETPSSAAVSSCNAICNEPKRPYVGSLHASCNLKIRPQIPLELCREFMFLAILVKVNMY
jgi:hypothetical protein